MIRLMLDTGARRGEIAGLQWRNVNFEDNTIRIANNLQYSPALDTYDKIPKGKKNRTIDIDPDFIPKHQQSSSPSSERNTELKNSIPTPSDTPQQALPSPAGQISPALVKSWATLKRAPHWDLTDEDCDDAETFEYRGRRVWNGF